MEIKNYGKKGQTSYCQAAKMENAASPLSAECAAAIGR